MIKMHPSEYRPAAVDDKTLKAIAQFHDRPVVEQFLYGDVMRHGSAELQEIVFIITGGVAPGNKQQRSGVN